jgi:hypothetical protein
MTSYIADNNSSSYPLLNEFGQSHISNTVMLPGQKE